MKVIKKARIVIFSGLLVLWFIGSGDFKDFSFNIVFEKSLNLMAKKYGIL